ncbi:MAG: exosortase-associated protein EpsI, B-type [Betaproteobacteria bacterium]|jgi:EpsI family protein|nr:EpsI family protein [Rhodocyclaceae bacterium]MCA3143599.1 EpsI family protein [Rhodocyclaceae bacterium]MCE2898900.1 EpsI family protein [Betaproteobacteria bacterium]
MNSKLRRATLILLLMLAAAGLAFAAKPRQRVSELGPAFVLETLVPRQFGAWRVDERVLPVIPDPSARALMEKIYSQNLARTYVDTQERRIMLTIAYGSDQSDDLQVHKPEVCYAAQGFNILNEARGTLETAFGLLPVKRLLAQKGARNEPITYWVTVGGRATPAGLQQKLEQLSYGLTGKVPDGMLVRVSSIDRDEAAAYKAQAEFLQDLLGALRAEERGRFGLARPGARSQPGG